MMIVVGVVGVLILTFAVYVFGFALGERESLRRNQQDLAVIVSVNTEAIEYLLARVKEYDGTRGRASNARWN